MDFRKELAKYGYNKGNSIDVETLIDEILPSLFHQQEKSYSEEVAEIFTKEDIREAFYADSRIWLNRFKDWQEIDFEEWFEQFKNK